MFNVDLLYLSIYIKMGVQMFVCLLVCGGLMETQTPAPILMKFSTHIPTCPRKVLVQVWPPPPHPLGLGGLKPLKLKDTFLRCSAGCKLTRAAPGASASTCIKIMDVQMFESMFVGMWRANLKPHPLTSLSQTLHTHPPMPKESFDPNPPSHLRLEGPQNLKADRNI